MNDDRRDRVPSARDDTAALATHNPLLERATVREMVEETWRKFLTFAASGSQALGRDIILRFDEKVARQAASMSAGDAAIFTNLVEDERNRIFDEYTSSPEALKRRLGVGAPVETRTHASNDLGNLAVRTAVRATVWETIISLFRLFR
jgi:hypothetical protein